LLAGSERMTCHVAQRPARRSASGEESVDLEHGPAEDAIDPDVRGDAGRSGASQSEAVFDVPASEIITWFGSPSSAATLSLQHRTCSRIGSLGFGGGSTCDRRKHLRHRGGKADGRTGPLAIDIALTIRIRPSYLMNVTSLSAAVPGTEHGSTL